MNMNFKPLGLAAAVAAASVGYAGVTAADPSVSNNGLGDLALIPYYSVRDGYGTGVHIINSGLLTQVVKVRFRRASDSLDAMDFNIVMSPLDEWVGFLQDVDGVIQITSQDSTCTVPAFTNNTLLMPNIYRDGADEGYVEVIAMGAADIDEAISANAVHVDGANGSVPANCGYVRDNFLDTALGGQLDDRGIIDNDSSRGLVARTNAGVTTIESEISQYEDGGNELKVSWFIRNTVAGLEFGNDAVMISDFSDDPMMSHQEQGIYSGNLRGFDFPDLDGGAPSESMDNVERGKFNLIRSGSVLGVASIINDWSNNADLNVGTDWIVTFPGQYTMLDMPRYLGTLGNLGGLDTSTPGGVIGGGASTCDAATNCDNRDLPVEAVFSILDREENIATTIPGDREVVISPSIPGLPANATLLKHEVNVIHWADREVMDSDYDEVDVSAVRDLLTADSGWARLAVKPFGTRTQSVCQWDTAAASGTTPAYNPLTPLADPNTPVQNCDVAAEPGIPMVGFVAWERSFAGNEGANYGRAVAHSFDSTSTP
jgi:hypothetical protein